MKIIWSPRALERVVEIGEYIVAQDRPSAAANWVEGVFASVGRLRRFPRSGREVPERRREDLREVLYGSYRVIYRIDPEQILVLTVRHSRIPILPDDIDLSD